MGKRILIVELVNRVLKVVITMGIMLGIVQIFLFVDVVLIGLTWPQCAIHAHQLGLSFVQIGMLGALYLACQAISTPIIASLSVKGTNPNFPIFVLCSAVHSLAYYCLGMTSSVSMFFVISALLGSSNHNKLLIMVLLKDYATNKHDVLYNKYIVIAGVLTPVVSGHVLDIFPSYGFTILTFVVGTMFAINTGLIAIIPEVPKEKKENSNEITDEPEPITKTLNKVINELYTVEWSMYWDIFLYQMLITLTMGLHFSSVVFFLTMEHGLPPKGLVYILAFHVILRELSNYYSEHVIKLYKHDTDFSRRIFHMFTVMTLCFLGLVSASDILTYIAILVPMSICDLLGRDICAGMIVRRSDPGQEEAAIATTNSVKTVTRVLSPVIAGIIAQYVGITYIFYMAVFVNATGVTVSNRVQTLVKSKLK